MSETGYKKIYSMQILRIVNFQKYSKQLKRSISEAEGVSFIATVVIE